MKKLSLYFMAGLATLAGLSSCDRDNGGSPEDSIFVFDIPTVKQTAEYPVGCFYINVGSGGQDKTRYERLQKPYDPETNQWGPELRPTLGNYGVDQNPDKVTDQMVENIQQEVDWCIAGGVDFWILPAVKPKQNQAAPACLDGDYRLYDIIRGAVGSDKAGSGKHVDMKSLKFVATVNIEDPLCKNSWETYNEDGTKTGNKTETLSNKILLDGGSEYESHDDIVSWVDGRAYRRSEVFAEMVKSLEGFFADSHYYFVEGRPMVVLQNAHKLYTINCKAFYDNLRAEVKAATGYEPFFVAQMDAWTPPARYEYFFTGVDAVAAKNMYNNDDFTRYNDYPHHIYLNFEYCLEYFRDYMGGIDFIPTGGPAYNKWVNNQEMQKPYMWHDADTWRQLLNIMKANAGRNRIVFIDSFNQFQYASFITPTDEDYGNGYGTRFLDIIKEEMDVR